MGPILVLSDKRYSLSFRFVAQPVIKNFLSELIGVWKGVNSTRVKNNMFVIMIFDTRPSN